MQTSLLACGEYGVHVNPASLATLAVSSDAAQADRAILKLRALGPAGLEALLKAHPHLPGTPIDERVRRAIDRVSGQRDAHASRLFWHTDLEQAKAAARQLGRPILSLRLLGRLDEELSCANSRFFRTALYPDPAINEFLRANFVLHWESVRPAPRITIDFGDGRRLERTITGNSIHYVLAPDGAAVDALPGLYGPKAFLRALTASYAAAVDYAGAGPETRNDVLRTWHQRRLAAIIHDWRRDLIAAGNEELAGARADLEKRMTADLWRTLARRHADDARLDPASRTLIRAKNPRAAEAGAIVVTKAMVEDPLLRAMAEFERSMAEDTVRNEYLLHTRIHEWFAANPAEGRDIVRLNNRVYSELFLTPASDPWLGLNPANAFTGLERGGISFADLAHSTPSSK